MWFFISREALPFPKRRQLTSSNRMRQGPNGAMQGDPALKHERDSVVKTHACQGSNRPRRVPKKLRKGHHNTICSSDRSRISSLKQASVPLQISTSHITNNDIITSSLQQKIPEFSAESHRVPKVMLECRGLKARNLPECTSSKLQKKFGNGLAHKKLQKKKSKDHSKKVVKETTSYQSPRHVVSITAEVNSARLKKRKRKAIRCREKYSYGNASSTSQDIIFSPRSSLSGPSERAAACMFSALDALSARPTIKCASKPRYVPPYSHTTDGLGNEGQRRRRTTISEADFMANKRVDCLADRLSAHELRELMDRDQKRKEKKRLIELARMEKRLSRWSEMQTATRVVNSHESSPEDELFKPTCRPKLFQSSSEPISDQHHGILGYFKEPKEKQMSCSHQPGPYKNRLSDSIIQNTTIADPGPDKTISTLPPEHEGQLDETSPTKKAKRTSLSQYLTLRLSTSSAVPTLPVDRTKTSPPRPPQSWSIFKLSTKNKRESIPPSFSTTSRDSLPSGSTPCFNHTPMRSATSIPKRTVSRFREDLPELPISSQSSKILSFETPELQEKMSKSGIIEPLSGANQTQKNTHTNDQNYFNYKNSTSNISSSVRMDTSSCINTLSQSVASIESEASWLSNGKRRLKNSAKKVQKHLKSKSMPEREKHHPNSQADTKEQVNVINREDYFSRKSTDYSDIYSQSPIDFGEEASIEDKKWGAVARQPKFVHSSSNAHRSRHGILNEIEAETEVDSYSVSLDTPIVSKQGSSG